MGITLGHRACLGVALGAILASCASASGSGNVRDNNVAKSEKHGSDRPAVGGGPRDPERRFGPTLAKIAGARCDREMRCGNVGPNQRFPTRESCVTKTEAERSAYINSADCSLGVSQNGLLACLAAIRDEDCGNPLDSITPLKACRSNRVCLQ